MLARSPLLVMLAGLALGCAGPRGSALPAPGTYGAADLWLEPVRVHGRVVFAGELEPVADALAEVLSRPEYGAHRVVPPPAVRALWSEAQVGRLPGLDFVCAATPPPGRLVEAMYAGASRASVDVQCDHESCALTVVVHAAPSAGARGEARARYAARWALDEAPSAWAARLRAGALAAATSAPSGEADGEAGGEAGRAPPGPRVTLEAVTLTGPWAYELDRERFQVRVDDLRACRPPGAVSRDGRDQPFQIEVDPLGQVTRCEPQHPDRLWPPGFACRCNVLRTLAFGIGTPGRRARFVLEVTDEPTPRAAPDRLLRAAALADARSDDPTATLGPRPVDDAGLRACLASVAAPFGELAVPVRFAVGADGRVRAHAADWPDALPAPTAECLGAALARAHFNCPLSGAAEVEARLALRVAEPPPAVDRPPDDRLRRSSTN